ncbi:MAG TPA: Crp/Fnr family transcriptional regulator [Prevotella sp.]|jgi:CRP-like cAMP-binding protein|nr:Crp/Fnr family transcriptional regulator [Prevotella sp.]
MIELQIFDNLLRLPLFQGISKFDLSNIVSHTKFDFNTIAADEVIINEGDPCIQLYFILSGKIELMHTSDDHSYHVVETTEMPVVIQPEHIFGLRQHYTCGCKARTETKLVAINKKEILQLLNEYVIFRLNLLNMLSTRVQNLNQRPWHKAPDTLEKRVTNFFVNHCQRPAGEKIFTIKMNQLALEVGDSRLEVSRALNNLQDRKLLTLHRGKIYIPALEKLLM